MLKERTQSQPVDQTKCHQLLLLWMLPRTGKETSLPTVAACVANGVRSSVSSYPILASKPVPRERGPCCSLPKMRRNLWILLTFSNNDWYVQWLVSLWAVCGENQAIWKLSKLMKSPAPQSTVWLWAASLRWTAPTFRLNLLFHRATENNVRSPQNLSDCVNID